MRKTWIFSCFILLSVLWCLPINGQQLASYAKDGVIRVKLDPAVAEQLGNTPGQEVESYRQEFNLSMR